MTKVINTEINVNAYYFAGQDMRTFPKQIEFDGQSVTFGGGMRYRIQRGQTALHVYDMEVENGHGTYRLSRDGGQWMLLALKGVY